MGVRKVKKKTANSKTVRDNKKEFLKKWRRWLGDPNRKDPQKLEKLRNNTWRVTDQGTWGVLDRIVFQEMKTLIKVVGPWEQKKLFSYDTKRRMIKGLSENECEWVDLDTID